MITYPASLLGVGGARTGIAPVNMLDIQTLENGLFFWADRKIAAPSAILGGAVAAVPPVAIPAGQSVGWAFPTAFSVAAGSPNYTANANPGSAFLAIVEGNASSYPYAEWSGFQPPDMPNDSVIQAIYPVFMAVGTGSLATTSSTPAAAFPATGEFEGEYYGASLGNTMAAITAAVLQVQIEQTTVEALYQDLTVSFVGLAVYYASSFAGSNGMIAYAPWLLSVPSFAFHRSLQTDMGQFVVQNVSGDTLSRDVERTLRASAMEGAYFIYRLWQPGAQAAWLEVHGTLTVADVGVDTMTLRGTQLLNPSQDDTPLENYSETCQLVWGQARCGSTAPTECSYSYQTCTSLNRIMIVANDYEKNFGETTANTALNVINRRRKI